MAQCININHPEVLALKEKSGLSDEWIEIEALWSMDKYGRMPYLDELQGADSSKYLKERLNLDEDSVTKFEKIVDMTGKESIPEINAQLNNDLRDQEISIMRLNEEAIVDIKSRPVVSDVSPITIDLINIGAFWREQTNRMAKLYGINIIPVNNDILTSEKWQNLVPNASSTNAFVYNGNIYINTDVANIDAPLHEMMHIFLGSMRFQNPELYLKLINLVEKLPNYEYLMEGFSDRSRNDANEEIFVSEFSKYLSGLNNYFDNIPDGAFRDIFYNIYRTLDTVLMGESSTKIIPKNELINMSLKKIAEKVSSTMMLNLFIGTMNDAEQHRILANTKSDLIKQGRLKQYC